MSAVWLVPYSMMDSSATADSRSLDSGGSFVCQETPQLTAHDYRRWQYSPVLSVSSALVDRRLRRKPSIQNLTGRSAQTAFAQMPSSVPPLSIHNFSACDPRLHQPSTPRPRAYTASPSLSSTITTLQSTPTRTPILRAGSFDEQRKRFGTRELEESVSTKRKYPSVKHARRFPRRQTGEEGSRDSGVYKVYAAVFDLSGEGEGLSKDSRSQAAPISKQTRAVRFGETNNRHDYENETTSSSGQSLHRRDRTVTSSFSLSKFEFPAPPNKDNWSGAINHLPKSPSATVLYRGASFDLINPHASLLLETHDIETPAEIDCLLDDYFEEHDDVVITSSNPDEMSQPSLRSVGDSKQTHILYDDADTARRNILRIPTPIPARDNTASNDPPATAVSSLGSAHGSTADVFTGPTPPARSMSNPFRDRMSTIGRSFGFTASPGNRNLTEESRSPGFAGTYGFSTSARNYITQRHDSLKYEGYPSADDGERDSYFSNPFDLSCSEVGNNAERMNIDGVPKRERGVMLASTSDPTGRRTALNVEDGSNTPAISESGGDYELSFIDRYNYTRESTSRAGNNDSSSSISIERGRVAKDDADESSHGWVTPVSPNAQFRSSSLGFRTVDDLDDLRPQPLASSRDRVAHHDDMPSIHHQMRLSGTSDVPTSEKTYGETNQLLQITSNANTNPVDGNNSTDGRQNPLTRTLRADLPWGASRQRNNDMDDRPGSGDDESIRTSFDYRSDSPPRITMGMAALSPSVVHINPEIDMNRISVQSQFRTSSEHRIGDSDWVDIHGDEPLDEDHTVNYANCRNGNGGESEGENEDLPGYNDDDSSPGYTEDEDLDETGNRYAHSISSDPLRRPTSMGNARSTASTDHRQRLALDSFPNLNDPSPEISPQRKRNNSQGRDDEGKRSLGMRRSPVHYPNSQPRDRIERAPRPGRPIDFAVKPSGDVKRALAIMKRKATVDKLGAGKFMSQGEHTNREFGDMQELERIRVCNHEALDEATARFEYERREHPSPPNIIQTSSSTIAPASSTRNKLMKPQVPLSRQNYGTPSSFRKFANFGRQEADHGSSSSQRGLLSPPELDTSLHFSPSENTFVTIRPNRSGMRSNLDRSRNWDPHGVNPTDHALNYVQSAPSTGNVPNGRSMWRSTSGRSGQQATPAIDGQVELRQFMLRTLPVPKPLTDEELIQRAPNWNQYPTENTPNYDSPRILPYHTSSEEQMRISLKYQTLSVLLPFCALIYGLGGFDWIIARKTQGRIKSMGSEQKCYALKVYFPLQLLAYVIVGVVTGIIIYMTYN